VPSAAGQPALFDVEIAMIVRAVRSFLAVVVAACAAAGVLVTSVGARPQGQQKVALVTVVADASGPIKNLTAKDFIVTDDNTKREVIDAQLADDPLSIALLVDTTQPPMGAIPPTQDLRTAVTSFIKTVQAGSPSAKISLSEIAGAAVTPVNFTTKFEDLEKAINHLVPNEPRYAVLLEALVDASKRLGEQPPPRRAIVSIDFNSQEGSAERMLKDAVEAVHKAGATLWPVSVRGSAQTQTTPIREEALNKITQANGGMRFQPVDAPGLEPNLKAVANSLNSQYSITFVRTGGGNPKSTRIETSKGAKVLLTPWMR
jgi:hypothetical protein